MSNDIIDIKKIDLNNPAEVEEAARVIINYDLFVEAYLLLKRLEGREDKEGKEGIEGKGGKGTEKLEIGNWKLEIIPKLKWVALPKFSEDEIVKMFGESFTAIFEIKDYDLWGKIKQKIITDIWYEDRDNFKKAIGKALLKNTERLTSQNIIINGKEEHPTVGNWLKDYNVNLGFAPVNATKQSEYLTNSGNMKRIKNQELRIKNGGEGKEGIEGKDGEEGMKLSEKDKLKILFNFYEKLKLSSLTAEGLEEDIFIDEDGVRGVLSEGVFTKIDPKMEQRLAELQEIIDNSQKSIKSKVHKVEGGEISELHAARMPWENSKKQENNKTTKQEEKGARPEIGGGGEVVPSKNPPVCPAGSRPSARTTVQSGRPLEKGVEQRANKAYIFSLDDQKVIKENEEDIKRRARGNIILVGKELTRALEEKNRPRVIAALRIAVKNNLLIGWAEKNQGERIKNQELRIKNEGEGEKKLDPSDERPSHSTGCNGARIRNLKLSNGEVIIRFLRKVLEQKLGLNEHEAAKIGVHIYNLFRKLGRDVGYLGYYDEQTGRFCWIAKDGGGE